MCAGTKTLMWPCLRYYKPTEFSTIDALSQSVAFDPANMGEMEALLTLSLDFNEVE